MALTSKTLFLCVGLGSITGWVSGCDKFIEAVSDKAQDAVEGGVAGVDGGPQTEDEKLGTKLQAYIDCINSNARDVHRAADRYFDWVDPKAGLTGTEKNVFGLFEVNDPKQCIEGIKAAADLEPDDTELETAGQAFADALGEAASVANEAHKYYDEKNYADDAFAKGKELHPKLMAAFEKFDTADTALRKVVGTQNDALQERDLERVEKEMGKNAMWHNKKIMVLAKKLIRVGDVPAQPELALDMAAFEPALTEFETEVDAAAEYAKAHKAEVDSVTSYSSFLDQASELKKAGKELLRRKRDNKAFTKDELDRLATGPVEWVEGSPGKLNHHYNELVSDSNRLNWNFYKPNG
jgi:hypothetical protein